MTEPELLDEADLQRVWRGVTRTRARNTQRRRLIAASLASAVVSAIAGWWLGSLTREPPELEARAPIEQALVEAGEVVLTEGSRVTPEADARLTVLELTPDTLTLMLAHGAAELDVLPAGGRRVLVECGTATVELRDALARVVRVGGRAEVQVRRGSALVRGESVPERVQRVEAGRGLVIERAHPGEVPASAAAVATRAAYDERGRAEALANPIPERASPMASPAARTTAISLSARSAATDARGSVVSPDDPAVVPPRAPAPQAARDVEGPEVGGARPVAPDPAVLLLARADRARAAQQPEQAAALLDELVTNYSQHPAAPLAAFELGRLELDVLGRPARAARALERALALELPAALAEDARARRVEAYAGSGDRDRARAAAAEYRARHPAGRRLADVERWSPR
jgi:transmembrane sensor